MSSVSRSSRTLLLIGLFGFLGLVALGGAGIVLLAARSDVFDVATGSSDGESKSLDEGAMRETPADDEGSEDSAPSEMSREDGGPSDSGGSSGNNRDQPNEQESVGVICDPDTIGEEDGTVVAIYEVENGVLGALCFGEASDEVLQSWDLLDEFTDPEQLLAIKLFAGIESDTVFAFAGPASIDSYDDFIIAVDVYSADDLQELRLTMAHELSHIFTQDPEQFDESQRRSSCDTYYNGYVCFLPDSYITAWVETFWTEEMLDDLPKSGSIDEEGGEGRCTLDRSFLGSYAASHPEEDFAEAFSAFVFGLDVAAEAEPRLQFFEAYPELVAYRDRAIAAGQTDLPNTLGQCG